MVSYKGAVGVSAGVDKGKCVNIFYLHVKNERLINEKINEYGIISRI